MTKDEALRLALEALEILKQTFFKNGCDDLAEWEKHHVAPAMKAIAACEQALEQPAQTTPTHPMMDMSHDRKVAMAYGYTSPPKREPLTDEQIAHATAPIFMGGNPSLTGIARAIEAAHGIKGET